MTQKKRKVKVVILQNRFLLEKDKNHKSNSSEKSLFFGTFQRSDFTGMQEQKL